MISWSWTLQSWFFCTIMNAAPTSSSSNTLADRVRNALASVATNGIMNRHLSSATATIAQHSSLIETPASNNITSVNNNVSQSSLCRPCVKLKSVTAGPSSVVTVKNRFKHTRPVRGCHTNTPERRTKPEADHKSNNCNSSSDKEATISTNSAVSVPLSMNDEIEISTPSPMQLLSNSVILCIFCQSNNDVQPIGTNSYRCNACNQQWLHTPQVVRPPSTMLTAQAVCPLTTFYGLRTSGPCISSITPKTTLTNSSAHNAKKRTAPTTTKVAKKKKNIETVDLVSSDEDERKSSPKIESSVAKTSVSTEKQTNDMLLAKKPVASGGTIKVTSKAPSPPLSFPPPPPSSSVSCSSSPVPPGEYRFKCKKAMFGELHGYALLPTRVLDNRMYLSLECIIYRDGQPISEKYTLSVGHNDVHQIKVYFGRVPSFVAIEAAPRFAEVACERIGRDVLVPSSDDPKKRYIILALDFAFKDDIEASVELTRLMSCVSPWARVQVLQLEEAIELIRLANLDVNQQEHPIGPVRTLLIYPPPPKTGGIPVTTEDVACLAEGTYLNDIIIDFYLKYLYEDVLSQEQRDKTYIFNSYFYKRLTHKSSRVTATHLHNAVKKWTRNVDIFAKDFIVIPVNEHSHWYLVIVCFPGQFFECQLDLDEKDEEDSEDEVADFVKETKGGDFVQSGKIDRMSTPAGYTDIIRNAESDKSGIPILSNPELDGNVNGESASTSNANGESESTSNASDASASTSNASDASASTSNASDASASTSNASDATASTSNATGKSSSSPLEQKHEKIVYKQAFEIDDFNRPCILIFDSLVGSGHSRVFTNLRLYLSEEWRSRKPSQPPRVFDKTNMKGCYPKIPRQNNDCDCGVFLLQYVESFFTQTIKSFRLPIHLEDWFTLEHVSRKRENIKQLIDDLAGEKLKNTF